MKLIDMRKCGGIKRITTMLWSEQVVEQKANQSQAWVGVSGNEMQRGVVLHPFEASQGEVPVTEGESYSRVMIVTNSMFVLMRRRSSFDRRQG